MYKVLYTFYAATGSILLPKGPRTPTTVIMTLACIQIGIVTAHGIKYIGFIMREKQTLNQQQQTAASLKICQSISVHTHNTYITHT